MTSSGLADDIAYTANNISNTTFKNDKKIVFAPKTIDGVNGESFYMCTALKYVSDITLTNANDSSYFQMFYGDTNLQSVGNINRVATNTVNANSMFNSCGYLKSVGTIDMENITQAENMFATCSKLTTIGGFTNATSLTTTNRMFFNTSLSQASADIISRDLDTSNVTDFQYMFNVSSTSPDVDHMFTTAPTLDMSSATNVDRMFNAYGKS